MSAINSDIREYVKSTELPKFETRTITFCNIIKNGVKEPLTEDSPVAETPVVVRKPVKLKPRAIKIAKLQDILK